MAKRQSASRRRITRRYISIVDDEPARPGVSPANSGGAIAFRHGTAPDAKRSRCHSPAKKIRLPARTADQANLFKRPTFSTLGSHLAFCPCRFSDGPSITAETQTQFNAFYPTSLLVCGFDILFLWVSRMIMFGCWFSRDVPMPDGSPRSLAESVPFREVYIHALIRDANREKMSKTKGNVVDPIEIVKQYGTDAVRFTLASMASPGTDIAFNVARTEGYRAFANKIWNAARFIFMNVDRAAEIGITVDRATLGQMPTAPGDAPLEARWIIAELYATSAKVNLSLENYRFDDAANTIYQFFWGSFCDWYLEIVKLRLDFTESANKSATKAALTTLVQVFECALRLLSPFMPFITEEIWNAVYDGNPPAKSIALTHFPSADGGPHICGQSDHQRHERCASAD